MGKCYIALGEDWLWEKCSVQFCVEAINPGNRDFYLWVLKHITGIYVFLVRWDVNLWKSSKLESHLSC